MCNNINDYVKRRGYKPTACLFKVVTLFLGFKMHIAVSALAFEDFLLKIHNLLNFFSKQYIEHYAKRFLTVCYTDLTTGPF